MVHHNITLPLTCLQMKVRVVSTILVAITIDACVKSTTAFVTSQTSSNHVRNTGESSYRALRESDVGLLLELVNSAPTAQAKELMLFLIRLEFNFLFVILVTSNGTQSSSHG